MNEKAIRQIVQQQLANYHIRSCRLDKKSGRYIYEAYAPDESITTAQDPYYVLNSKGIVTHVNVAVDPGRVFGAPIIWRDNDDELMHAFENPLKGIMREGHKYIERIGEPGHYKYIYERAKKTIDNTKDKISKATNTTKEKTGWLDDLISPQSNYSEPVAPTAEEIKYFDRPTLSKLIPLDDQLPKKSKDYSLNSCKSEGEFIQKRKKDLNEINDGPKSFFDESSDRYWNGNCGALAYAFELRCRGYDVQGQSLPYGISTTDDIHLLHDKSGSFNEVCICDDVVARKNDYKGDFIQPHQFESFKTEMLKEPNKSRGFINICYYGGGAHVFNYERVNDKLVLYDGQSNSTVIITKNTDELPTNFPLLYAGGISFIRTDDKDINTAPYVDLRGNERSLFSLVEPAKKGGYYKYMDIPVDKILAKQNKRRELIELAKQRRLTRMQKKQELRVEKRIEELSKRYRQETKTKGVEKALKEAKKMFDRVIEEAPIVIEGAKSNLEYFYYKLLYG